MNEPNETFQQLTEGAAKVKLPGGIVGKTCYVLMAVCGALAAIVIAIRTEAIGYTAIIALVLIVVWALNRVFRFADANPELATMDGSEIVSYKRMQFAQKGKGDLPVLTPSSPSATHALAPSEEKDIYLPDPTPSKNPTEEPQ